MSDPRMVNKEVNAPQVVQILQEVWAHHHSGQAFPEMTMQTVRRMMSGWPWATTRGEGGRQATAAGCGPDAAIWFVFKVLHLCAEGVESCDILNAGETASLLCPRAHCTWAGRGSAWVQIHVAGSERQSCTVMVAVTMGCRKLRCSLGSKARRCDPTGCQSWTCKGDTCLLIHRAVG